MSQLDAKPAKPVWQKTPTANLVRYVASGTYYARAKVGGKFHRQSLKTKVLTVARLRVGDAVKGWQATSTRRRALTGGTGTLGAALDAVVERQRKNPALKPKTIEYSEQMTIAIRKHWADLDRLPLRSLVKQHAIDWAATFGRYYAPSVFNHALSLLRHAADIGVEQGTTTANVFRGVKRLRDRSKHLTLPTKEQFTAFVKAVRLDGSGKSGHCADLVAFLAFGGFRKTEAANVRWQDCDFARGEITVFGDPDTGTKNSEVRRLPMIGEMRDLLERLRKDRGAEPKDARVMKVAECQKAMNRAAASVGMARVTHHDLRHLFATRCIESGVDVPTVSRWLGHKDGGALAMRTYGHLRHEHSIAMAQKVSFS